jgi:hypothetical protein
VERRRRRSYQAADVRRFTADERAIVGTDVGWIDDDAGTVYGVIPLTLGRARIIRGTLESVWEGW